MRSGRFRGDENLDGSSHPARRHILRGCRWPRMGTEAERCSRMSADETEKKGDD